MNSDGVQYNAGDQPFVQVWVGDPAGKPTYLGVMPDGRGNNLGSLLSFEFQHQQGNVGTLHLELFDPTHGDIEDKIFASRLLDSPADGSKVSGSSVLGFQFGWANGAKSLKWNAHVIDFTTNFDLGSGTKISINAIASPGNLQIGRATKVWKKDTEIVVILDYYAKESGAPTPSIINPEARPLAVDLAQYGQAHVAFLSNVLAKHIISKATGRGGYMFNIDGSDKGRFILSTDGKKENNTEWVYVFGREQNSTLESFEVTLNSQVMRSLGGQGVKVEYFDPRAKKAKSQIINDTTTKGRLALEENIAPASAYPAILRSGLANDAAAIAYAEDKFAAMNMLNITASAALLGNPSMQLYDIVTILVARQKENGSVTVEGIRDLHPASGRFFIQKISHYISADGSYKTELSLMKHGAKDSRYGGSAITQGTRVAKVAAKTANEAIVKAVQESGVRATAAAEETRQKQAQAEGK
jgi:hypothetical protein